jgi:hypothetical protein
MINLKRGKVYFHLSFQSLSPWSCYFGPVAVDHGGSIQYKGHVHHMEAKREREKQEGTGVSMAPSRPHPQ